MTSIRFLQGLVAEQLAVVDALLRFGEGTDAGDAAMLASAFAPDATIDFGACGHSLGLDIAPLRGRAAIVAFLGGTVVGQVTSHVVSNARVAVADGRARLSALVDAEHISREEPARRFRMLNRYEAELTAAELHESGPQWQIERLAIDNVHFDGDPRTMLERGAA